MTAQIKTVLKSYFETGDKPTAAQFVNLIDSIPGEAGVLGESEIPAAIARDAEVTAAILAGAPGGATVTAAMLKEWVESSAFEMTAITYHGTYTTVIATATVKWPDGSAGALTVDTINTTWLAIDAYHITHIVSGKTVTQAAVTRNAAGQITIKPALTVV